MNNKKVLYVYRSPQALTAATLASVLGASLLSHAYHPPADWYHEPGHIENREAPLPGNRAIEVAPMATSTAAFGITPTFRY